MHTASVSTQRVVNVDAEISYWRGIHAEGHLGGYDFADYARVLTLGYDIYLAYPRATEAQLYRVLQDGYYRYQPALSVPWDQARWIVRQAWRHMEDAAVRH
ncbi:hypothetical protein ABFU27_20185 [Xanthomonas campestris pv. raphani]|uniref:hypothetical protein n=1 Tax=Xanthomonas campestris TaxID=339 RepID=UPI000E0F079B|nr:hypothetical protein [Xanthomonas campestris]MCC5065249.1 hypothetical protein [Xanthomonas campestris pv. raphani]MEA9606208.1 hypothetical protein [Xanthomonas campestris pv. plantaginis]MEA9786613.1 hypothetical protein [Xanthomonas campestris pv. raphani]MEA9844769.1 hypothetical protein [Xanthomonas campestris pv. raphani]MEA9862166.1 hypothetical protein [Xanthomonas campestris pv. raphani]